MGHAPRGLLKHIPEQVALPTPARRLDQRPCLEQYTEVERDRPAAVYPVEGEVVGHG